MDTDWLPQDSALQPAYQAWRRGDLEEAEGAFVSALDLNVHNADAWRGLGSVHWNQGRFEDSLNAFQAALRCDCYSAMNWANVGLSLRELGRRTQAIEAFVISVALEPNYTPAFNEWANVLFDDGRYVEALELYDRALRMDESRAVVHHNRGVCLRFLGEINGAWESFHRALELQPDYAHSILELWRIKNQISIPALSQNGWPL